MSEMISVTADDGGMFKAYLARPANLPAPGVVLIQEIFGVNEAMRAHADALAQEGFVAVVPDLFWRLEPGIELGYDEAGFQKGREMLGRFDVDAGVRDIDSTLSALRAHTDCTGRAGVVGFCLGGRMAYLAAARSDPEAAISFYGVRIHDYLDEAPSVLCPMILHFGEKDSHVPLETVAPIQNAFIGRGDITFYFYPDGRHGFYNKFRSDYHAQSAELAHTRTVDFLKRSLGV